MRNRLSILVALLLTWNVSSPAQTYRLSSGAVLKVDACSPNIVRVRVSPTGEFPQSLMERYGIIKTDWDAFDHPGASLQFDAASETLTLRNASGEVLVSGISFQGAGSKLCMELREAIHKEFGGLKTVRNSPIIGDDDGTLSEMDKTEGGDPMNSCVLRIPMKSDERFYGGGNTSREHIQHRGECLRMWATYQRTEIPMPFMMSSEGWGIYSNSTRKSYFDMGKFESDSFCIYSTEPSADFFIFAGEGMPDILNAYTLLTGRNYLLPRWAYGFCFGPNMKEDQWDILRDALSFQEMGMPCSVFWLEPQWMSKHYDFSTEKQWNYDKFTPEFFFRQNRKEKQYYPSLFIGKLNDMGLHLGLWVCEEYDLSITEEDAIPGAAPSGLEHWMDHLTKFVDMGVEGFKLDPARTLDEHMYRKYYNGRPDMEMHNLNQVLLPKQLNMMYSGHTGKRGWLHYCGGWSGTQHWGASTSGDNGGGKTALFDQLNLGNSGYMNTSCDVMFVDRDQEMQSLHFGTFLPWLQVNSWCSMMHPFYYTGKDREIYLNCIKLRYELLPYIYSAAIEGALTGMPMVRSMPLMFPDDRTVDDLCTQYMFGANLLVGIFTDEIYLPAGEWTDAWTGEKIMSRGETVRRPYPDDRAGLLFIREGAIVPCADVVKVYPCGESSYTLYDCDPESYGYENGLVAATRIDCSQNGKSVKIVVHPADGTYESMPAARGWTFQVARDKKPSRVLVNGGKTKDWSWQDGVLTVPAGEHPVVEKLEINIQ